MFRQISRVGKNKKNYNTSNLKSHLRDHSKEYSELEEK